MLGDAAIAVLGMVIVAFLAAVVIGAGLAVGIRLFGGVDVTERHE